MAPAPPVMSLSKAMSMLQRHWMILVAAPLIGVLLAGLWVLTQNPRYASTANALVVVGNSESLGVALTADNLAKSKAQQYALLGESRAVSDKAVEELPFDLSSGEALRNVEVASTSGSAQIVVRAEDSSPERAQQLASAWLGALEAQATEVEAGGIAGQSIISLETLSDASLPSAPSSPNLPLALSIGGALGLLAGLGVAVVRHVLDNKIRSAAALESRFGLTILGTVPESTRSARNRRRRDGGDVINLAGRVDGETSPKQHQDSFRLTESFKELRTNLQFLRPDEAVSIVTVTSAHPGEGKSTVAANLAVTVAESGQRVVLVDGDLRRPVVAENFGLISTVGLTDVVLGRVELADALQTVGNRPSLQVLASGPIPPNPSEILASDRFNDLINALAEDALVIIDAPPLLPVTDAAILARRFDGCLLVVSAGRTTYDEFSKAVSSIRKIDGEVLGAVLNRVPASGTAASAYQYYGATYYTASQQQDVAGRS
ncbi:polysaccharide biosynthesis tyrosine autokinase [Micrococcus lylae]|uniref:Polysaccharide biosynthesis tyrosine autokinase n=2 Tax=Micrococcus lylae TaxID=1273 RepID=A0ABY2K3Z4_9MICC|nr:polysaccharide biosynthesis tyrosine autokinase [Micrococcus lylae]